MLDFINIENSRDGLMKLVEIVDMYLNDEIDLKPCRYMLYYPVSAQDRFIDSLLYAIGSQLRIYTYFLGVEYKDDYLYWIMEEGREGYERAMLCIHSMTIS